MIKLSVISRIIIALLIVFLSFATVATLLAKRPASFSLEAKNIRSVRLVNGIDGSETMINDTKLIEELCEMIEPIRLFSRPQEKGTGWSYYLDFKLSSGESVRFVVVTSHMVEVNQRQYYASWVPNKNDIFASVGIETTASPTSAPSTSPSTVTFFEGSRIKSTFEEDITFSDACVIGRIISSKTDPDQTIDCLFQIDEVIYGDIKEKTIHVHQLPHPDLNIDTNKEYVFMLYIEDYVFYPHTRYYPMEQYQLSFDSKGNFKSENIEANWPVEAFASIQAFKEATTKIKQKNLPVDKYAKAQVKYTREKDPKKIWDFSDHVARVTIKALRGKGQYAWQYTCTVQSTLKGSPLPSEIWIHMLPGTEVGKTYLVLLVETDPGRPGTTYTISSLDSQTLAGSPQEAVYSSLGLIK